MNGTAIDVRTPIFSHRCFANALEAQSRKVYARLVHTPLIADSLPGGTAIGARVEEYAARTIRSLEDLERLLCDVLDEENAVNGSAAATATPPREDALDGARTTLVTPGHSALTREGGLHSSSPVSANPEEVSGRTADESSHLRAAEHMNPIMTSSEADNDKGVQRSLASLRAERPPHTAAMSNSKMGDLPHRSRWHSLDAVSPTGVIAGLSKFWERLHGMLRRRGNADTASHHMTLHETAPHLTKAGVENPVARCTLTTAYHRDIPGARRTSLPPKVDHTRIPTWVRMPFSGVSCLTTLCPTSFSGTQSMRLMCSPLSFLSVSPFASANVSQKTVPKTEPILAAVSADVAAGDGQCHSEGASPASGHGGSVSRPIDDPSAASEVLLPVESRSSSPARVEGCPEVVMTSHSYAVDPKSHCAAQHLSLSRPSAGDVHKDQQALELLGWLHLLVWVRLHVIHFLRDLSGVQGVVAWSAWYWSWAQEHPREAAFHQALSSRSFWKGVWAHGVHEELDVVQYHISRHMFTLKGVFQLIVSFIGATYTSLERLNTMIQQVQHVSEMVLPAGSAVTDAHNVAVSSATATLNRGPIGRAVSGILQEVYPDHGSMLWTPMLPTVTGGDDASSPLAQGDMHASQVLPQSTFAHAVPARSHSGTSFHEDVAERNSCATSAKDRQSSSPLELLMDNLRHTIFSTLHEMKALLSSDGAILDSLEGKNRRHSPVMHTSNVAPLVGTPGVAISEADKQGEGVRKFFRSRPGLPPHDRAATAAMTSTGLPGSAQVHFAAACAPTSREGSIVCGSHPCAARDGAQLLLQCVHHSRSLLWRLTNLVQEAHRPPTARHWQRVLVAAVVILPPFTWIYTKSPAHIMTVLRQTGMIACQLARAYLIEPIEQLRKSIFFVRPGVEERLGAFDRDAASLANIVRDFHEDMYPMMSLDRLEELRARTLERLRAGVADPEGLGVIDQHYRHSVRHPIRSVFFGDLPRLMLIQLSYQALEVSRVANGIDEVLAGNDVNFKIMAMMPVFLAGGLLVTWTLFRYRVKYAPLRTRMKLLWRSLFRILSLMDAHHALLRPFSRDARENVSHHHRNDDRIPHPTDAKRKPRLVTVLAKLRRCREASVNARGVQAAGITTVESSPKDAAQNAEHAKEDTDAVAFTDSEDESETSASGVTLCAPDEGSPSRQLNNYEQGMLLLLTHAMRSLAAELLCSYAFYHELVEDLNDLENVQSTRQQRLTTLERMRSTHTYLF